MDIDRFLGLTRDEILSALSGGNPLRYSPLGDPGGVRARASEFSACQAEYLLYCYALAGVAAPVDVLRTLLQSSSVPIRMMSLNVLRGPMYASASRDLEGFVLAIRDRPSTDMERRLAEDVIGELNKRSPPTTGEPAG